MQNLPPSTPPLPYTWDPNQIDFNLTTAIDSIAAEIMPPPETNVHIHSSPTPSSSSAPYTGLSTTVTSLFSKILSPGFDVATLNIAICRLTTHVLTWLSNIKMLAQINHAHEMAKLDAVYARMAQMEERLVGMLVGLEGRLEKKGEKKMEGILMKLGEIERMVGELEKESGSLGGG